jgi:16S rRNA A1518/A1519 N6-dimethyltransferase RsmA/KsgA/DIM1 with predicted DNA glycosylase/AP lyase activity
MVSPLCAAFGDILPGDVFADVGSGVGNVSIQVALQSRLDKSIAIEMREELATLTTAIVAKHKANEPRLGKLVVIEADIAQIEFADLPHMIGVTHVFSHNTLFDPKAMLKLETVCLLPKLRRMALSLLPCSRHSDR